MELRPSLIYSLCTNVKYFSHIFSYTASEGGKTGWDVSIFKIPFSGILQKQQEKTERWEAYAPLSSTCVFSQIHM